MKQRTGSPWGLVVDPTQLSRSEMGTIAGPIWLACPGVEPFPEEGWRDIPIPVLTAWIQELTLLSQRSVRETAVYFMDGPFRVEFRRRNGDVDLDLIRSYTDGDVSLGQWSGNCHWLLSQAVSEGKQLLHELRERGWENDDVEALRLAVGKARRLP